MTRLIERVIERLRAVPDAQQDQLAEFLLHELEQDERWAATSASHVDGLRGLIDTIVRDDERGDCAQMDPERL